MAEAAAPFPAGLGPFSFGVAGVLGEPERASWPPRQPGLAQRSRAG